MDGQWVLNYEKNLEFSVTTRILAAFKAKKYEYILWKIAPEKPLRLTISSLVLIDSQRPPEIESILIICLTRQ
jgi:hypothetical protein